jgi:hypothetical protein
VGNFEAVKFLGKEKYGGLGIGQRPSPPVKPAQQAAARDCTSKVFSEVGFSSCGKLYIINSSAAREPQALGGCSLRSHPPSVARDAIEQWRRGRSRCSPLRSLYARLGRSLRSRWPYAA